MADLYRCRCDSGWLTDGERLRERVREASRDRGFDTRGELFEASDGNGVAGILLAAGAQLQLRTWPGDRAVALDLSIWTAQESQRRCARDLVESLVRLFAPEWTEQRSLDRGDDS